MRRSQSAVIDESRFLTAPPGRFGHSMSGPYYATLRGPIALRLRAPFFFLALATAVAWAISADEHKTSHYWRSVPLPVSYRVHWKGGSPH